MIQDSFEKIEISQEELSRYIDEFLNTYNYGSEDTKITYKRLLKEFSTFFARNNSFFFRVEDVVRYKSYLEEEKQLRSLSVRSYFTSIRQFFNFLISKGVLDKNPAKRVQCANDYSQKEITYLTPSDIDLIFSGINYNDAYHLRDYTLLAIMLFGSVRADEITALNVPDFYKFRQKWYLKYDSLPDISLKKMSFDVKYNDLFEQYLRLRLLPGTEELPLFLSYSNRTAFRRLSDRAVRLIIDTILSDKKVLLRNHSDLTPSIIKHTSAVIFATKYRSTEAIMKRFGLKTDRLAIKYKEIAANYDI
jgi:site-specific recombinase XerD